MNESVQVALIGGVGGLLSGALVSLLAPWSHWGIEKRRLTRARQVELVEAWRSGITACAGHSIDVAMKSEWYESLRPNLDRAVVAYLERPRTSIALPDSHRTPVSMLLSDEVSRIERKWGLV